MNVLVSGGTGFIGRALIPALIGRSDQVVLLTRRADLPETPSGALKKVVWDGKSLDPGHSALQGVEAVIHLAGEPISAGRWTEARKRSLRESRIQSTRAIVGWIRAQERKPSVLLSVSAVGYYGDVPQGDVPESHPKGRGFLADLCADWEKESQSVSPLGVRVVNPRFGIVLAKEGGALKKMVPPFYFFLGGPPGPGTQYFPWIHRDDAVHALLFALDAPRLSGPVNFTAPEPLPMRDFCRALGKALHRPSWAPVPAFALRILLGEMSEMLLTGQNAVPRKLLEQGYSFRHPRADSALNSIFSDR